MSVGFWGECNMLRIDDQGAPLCDGVNRREWLRIGSLGMFGLTLPAFLLGAGRSMPRLPMPRGKAKACIVLFFLGGPPQHETWDPKPDAPADIRGDLRPIASAVPGMMVGELMPRTARLTKEICVMRAVTTNDNSHSSSGYYMTTGQPHLPMGVENARPGAPNNWPCLGAAGSKRVVSARQGAARRPSLCPSKSAERRQPDLAGPG